MHAQSSCGTSLTYLLTPKTALAYARAVTR